MNREQTMVAEFHEKMGQVDQDLPTIPSPEVCELRRALIQEELDEFVEAYRSNDLIEVADAIGDMLYVVYGAALACGLDIEPVFKEIHRSNCTKEGAGTRPDGKCLKGSGYQPPNLQPIIQRQLDGVCEIPLTMGYVALVSREDYPELSKYKWQAFEAKYTVYAMRKFTEEGGINNGKSILMHRQITSASPGVVVDHRDGNGINNTRPNLRLCSSAQNLANSRRPRGGSSKYKGVYWSKTSKKWVSQIGNESTTKYLGSYDSEIAAAQAYDAAATETFGEFAYINFQKEV